MSKLPVPIGQINRSLPEAGRIRIGVKSGKSMKAIDTFRFTSSDEVALGQVAQMYGGTVQSWSDPKAPAGQFEVITQAKEIAIILTSEPPSQHYELWSGGGCERRCDGATCTTTQSGPEGPEPVEVPCMCFANGALACKLKTRLSVILPGVQMSRGVTWRLDTGSDVAASALPEMVAIVQQLQGSGLTHATLSLRHVKSGSKRYIVPQIGVPHTIEQLAAGGSRLQSLGTGGGGSPSPAPALGAGNGSGEDSVPPSDDETPRVSPSPDPSHADDDIADAEIVDDTPPTEAMASRAQQARIFAGLKDRIDGKDERRAWASTVLGREVESFTSVTQDEAGRLIEWMEENW